MLASTGTFIQAQILPPAEERRMVAHEVPPEYRKQRNSRGKLAALSGTWHDGNEHDGYVDCPLSLGNFGSSAAHASTTPPDIAGY